MTRMTCGRGKPVICRGLATGARIFSISSARIVRSPRSSSRSKLCRRSLREFDARLAARGRRRSTPPRCRRASPCRARPCWSGLRDCRRRARRSWRSRRGGDRASSCELRGQRSPSRATILATPVCAARAPRSATGAKLSVWPMPSPSTRIGCSDPTGCQPAGSPFSGGGAKPGRARFHDFAGELRHARGRRVRPRRERKDVTRRRCRNP